MDSDGDVKMNSNNLVHAQLIPKSMLDDEGLVSGVAKHSAERIGVAISDLISDGNEYIVKMLPDEQIEQPDNCTVELRKGVAVNRLVRCESCIHRKHPADYCDMLHKAYMPDNFFCFYGKREEKENV